MIDYVVYDVFTDAPFGGNQLAVIPDASQIPEHQLQKIAREFNFSETTFVYPAEDNAHTAKVRIFTPAMEVPFAGHPTIGTAIALRDLGHNGDMVLELGVGPIPCSFDDKQASFVTSYPLETFGTPDIGLVARALSLAPNQIATYTHVPTQAGVGLTFVLVELVDRATLAACRPITDVFHEGAKKYPSGLDFAVFAYVRNGEKVDARMFAPIDDIPEDPATGSACAALAAFLDKTLDEPQSLVISQGEDMGRMSKIFASTEGSVPAVTITGTAIQTMSGSLHL